VSYILNTGGGMRARMAVPTAVVIRAAAERRR